MPHPTAAAPNSYRYHAPCQTCSGPGPTQCKTCPVGSVLAVWNSKIVTGSCHLYGSKKNSKCEPPGNSLRSCDGPWRSSASLSFPTFSDMKDPTVSTKWSVMNHAMRLPVNSTGAVAHQTSSLTVVAFCQLHKRVTCEPPAAGMLHLATSTKCSTQKGSVLIDVIVAMDTAPMRKLCHAAFRYRGSLSRCRVPAAKFGTPWHGYSEIPPVCQSLISLL